ncbi:hypothetical protein DPSP01_005738 [Paraphaeosphaeria sporulosa]
MSAKLHDFFEKFRRGAYAPLNTNVGPDEAGGFAYRANSAMEEMHNVARGSLRTFLKPALQIFVVIALMVGSYIFGSYSSGQQSTSTGFVPTIPLKVDPGVFSDDHSWIGPGKESDILWAKEYQVMSDNKFIKIDKPENYGIPPGQQDSHGVNFYSISVYHQLHCLSLFRALVYDESLSHNDGDHRRALSQNRTWTDWYHLGHCFNYLRQAIRCTVDTTLEFPPGNHTAKEHMATRTGNRQCRDISVLDEFVEQNRWIGP